MKRILIFSLAYYPHVGGAEVALKEITDRTPDIEFHMVTLRFDSTLPKTEKIGNVVVHRVGLGAPDATTADTHKALFYFSKILFVPRAAWEAVVLNRAHRYDAFWAMMSYMLFPIVLARFLGARIPYLLTLEEGDPFEHVYTRTRIKLFTPLLRWGFRHASAIHAESTFLGAWARQWDFHGPLEVIPNGVDFAHFSQKFQAEDIRRTQETLGKNPQNVFLVTTSRLVRKNAIDEVIRALALLPANVHFLVYGIGPEERSLRALAGELKVADRVHFNGYLLHEHMPLVLKSCDIYVRPSRSEGMGNVFIEAMAAELPVIATQEGGIADFLYDARRNPDKETTGWAVDKDSPEQIAEAVEDILAHPEQVARVKATAKKMVLERYDWNRIAREMQTTFDRVLDTRLS